MTTHQASSIFVVVLLTSALFVSISSVATPPSYGAPLTVTFPGGFNHGKYLDVINVRATGVSLTTAIGTTCSITDNSPGGNVVTYATMTVTIAGQADGSFIVGQAPTPAGGGSYTLTVTCLGDSGNIAFTVDPSLTISPSIGTALQLITVTGYGFFSNAGGCNNFLSIPGGLFAASPSAFCSITGGTVNAGFTVDSAAGNGWYDIRVVPNVGLGPVTHVNGFQKVSGPTIVLSPDGFIQIAPVGFGTSDGKVSVLGAGFSTGSARTCTLGTNPASTTLTSTSCNIDATGSVTGSFAVSPSAVPGGYTVRVTDTNPVGVIADVAFFVSNQPDIALGAASGDAGTSVSVLVAFNPFSQLDQGPCAIGPANLFSSYSCTIDATGSLTLTSGFVVSPTAPGGVYNVVVTPLHGDKSTAAPFTVTPKMTLSPDTGFAPVIGPPTATATEVTISGTGFDPSNTGCTISVTAGLLIIDTTGEPACTVTGSTGVLSAKFKVGPNSPSGPSTVRVTGNNAGDHRSATFTVQSRIVLSPASGAVGTHVNFAGSGFDSGAPGTASPCKGFAAGQIGGTPVGAGGADTSCSQDANGNVVGFFVVAAGTPSGSYLISYVDNSGSGNFATTTFVVTGGPVVTFSQYSGPTGTVVTVTGSGFNTADTSVTITTSVGPVELEVPASKVCTLTGGSIAAGCAFTVSSTAPGIPAPGYTLKVTGNTGDYSSANFFLIATLTLTPNNGGTGTLVTLSGSGFRAVSAACAGIIETPAPLSAALTCNIDGNGVLTGTFNVAGAAVAGAHTFTINNGAQVPQITVSASFAVTVPMVTFSPNSGSGDGVIQFTASGFSTGDTGPCSLTQTVGPKGNTIAATPPPSCNISGGIATGSFTVARANNGAEVKTLKLTGSTGDSVTAAFSVVPQISHTLTPNPARVGDTVTITGSNFGTAGGCTISGVSVAGSPLGVGGCVAADFTLTALAKFTVVIAFAGLSDTITVTDATPVSASATLNIIPHVVTLTPSSGPVGAVIGVTGTGFAVSDVTPCTIKLDGGVPAGSSCSMGVGGTVSGSFPIPAGTTAGPHTVTVTGNPGLDFGTATLLVTAAVTLVPNTGRAGTIVQVSGGGFAAGDTGACQITSSPSGLISTPPNPVCSIAGGILSGSFVVANVPGGSLPYTVTVTGSTGDSGSATFTVPPATTFNLLPTLGSTGTGVTASGSNFQGTTCQLTSSPGGLFTSQACTIAAGGALSGGFTVASSAVAGSLYTVTVQTNAGALDSATANFAVTVGTAGTLTLTPTSGPIGRVVSGVGSGFTTDTTCQLGAAPAEILSSPSCTITAGGNANIGFIVSTSAAPGSYNIMALGNMGRAASGTFTVTATSLFSISANPSSLTINPGGTGSVTVTVQSVGGFNSPVTLAASTFPQGVNGGLNANPVTPLPGGSANSVLSLTVLSTAPSTSSVITITGTSGTATATVSVSLNIQVIVTTATTVTSASTSVITTTGAWTPPKCVIATATFGSELSPEVVYMRQVRDEMIGSTPTGRVLVDAWNNFYYLWSPTIAAAIAGNELLRATFRVLLLPLVAIIHVTGWAFAALGGGDFAAIMAFTVAAFLSTTIYVLLPALTIRTVWKRGAKWHEVQVIHRRI